MSNNIIVAVQKIDFDLNSEMEALPKAGGVTSFSGGTAIRIKEANE